MPDDRSPQSRRVPDETASPLRYTITPGIHSPIAMKTLSHAVCHVHPEDDADPQHSFKLFADPDGIVRFHVRPAGESKDVAKLVVDCVVNGKLVRHPLHLRPSFEATSDMPSPPAERPLAQRADARIRPALSYDEAMRLTERDALARGYPMRPNPDEAPKAFSAWLRAVSAPAYGIEPYFVSNPDVTHGKGKQHAPQSFTNWSGFELLRSFRLSPGPRGIALTEPYDWVTGTWHVPAVTGERFIQTYSALWVGLDGDKTTDLVQAGTEQDAMNIWLPYVGELTLSRYYVWTEFLPQQLTEQIITNFTVSPGDEILTEVWVGRPQRRRAVALRRIRPLLHHEPVDRRLRGLFHRARIDDGRRPSPRPSPRAGERKLLTDVPYKVQCSHADPAAARCRLLSLEGRQRAGS